MDRRSFLKSVAAAIAAASTMRLPLSALAETATPITFTPPQDYLGLRTFCVTFPDGTRYTFEGYIQSTFLSSSEDDLVTGEMTIRPTRAPEVSQPPVRQSLQAPSVQVNSTELLVLEDNGSSKLIGNLEGISIPPLEENALLMSETDDYHVGLKRMGDITINLSWEAPPESLLPEVSGDSYTRGKKK